MYVAIGENDDYYGSGPAREAYEEIRAAYRARQHGAGGYLFAHDEDIMGWLFS